MAESNESAKRFPSKEKSVVQRRKLVFMAKFMQGVASRNKTSPCAEGVGINEKTSVVSMYSVLRAALYELAAIAKRMC